MDKKKQIYDMLHAKIEKIETGYNKQIYELINMELESANNKFGELFNSEHEAYAVLIEELDELFFEINKISELRMLIWDNVKANGDNKLMLAEGQNISLRIIKEAVQVGAMIKKYINTIGK